LQENDVFLQADGDFRQGNGVRQPDGWHLIDRN
jgi:hypothetical protein